MPTQQSISELIASIQNKQAVFADVLNFINTAYQFSETAFKNGDLSNAKTENQGSCRVFAVAKQLNLTEEETLTLFAEHYDNVLANPTETNHQNIRQFMKHGWSGIEFAKNPLQ